MVSTIKVTIAENVSNKKHKYNIKTQHSSAQVCVVPMLAQKQRK